MFQIFHLVFQKLLFTLSVNRWRSMLSLEISLKEDLGPLRTALRTSSDLLNTVYGRVDHQLKIQTTWINRLACKPASDLLASPKKPFIHVAYLYHVDILQQGTRHRPFSLAACPTELSPLTPPTERLATLRSLLTTVQVAVAASALIITSTHSPHAFLPHPSLLQRRNITRQIVEDVVRISRTP